MRITAQTKSATRKRILQSARRLFADSGYDTTTTRDIAVASQIATGTLFNYFPTKEAIVASLAREAIDDALASDIPTADTLEEDLFALVAAGLRKLRPLRRHLPSLLETSLSPLAATRPDDDATAFRLLQLDRVASLAAGHGFGPLPPTALQLSWTLYTGALLFWAGDESRGQQETLALLDDSVDMFVGWLRQQGTTPPGPQGP